MSSQNKAIVKSMNCNVLIMFLKFLLCYAQHQANYAHHFVSVILTIINSILQINLICKALDPLYTTKCKIAIVIVMSKAMLQ